MPNTITPTIGGSNTKNPSKSNQTQLPTTTTATATTTTTKPIYPVSKPRRKSSLITEAMEGSDDVSPLMTDSNLAELGNRLRSGSFSRRANPEAAAATTSAAEQQNNTDNNTNSFNPPRSNRPSLGNMAPPTTTVSTPNHNNSNSNPPPKTGLGRGIMGKVGRSNSFFTKTPLIKSGSFRKGSSSASAASGDSSAAAAKPLNALNFRERKVVRDAFNLFDADGSGTVSPLELSRVMETLFGSKLSQEIVDDMIADVDIDHDGEINFEEFIGQVTKMMNEPDEAASGSSKKGGKGRSAVRDAGGEGSDSDNNQNNSKGQWKKLGTLIKTFQENRTESQTKTAGIFSAVNQKHVEKQERKKVSS